jgi:hypothetical protein
MIKSHNNMGVLRPVTAHRKRGSGKAIKSQPQALTRACNGSGKSPQGSTTTAWMVSLALTCQRPAGKSLGFKSRYPLTNFRVIPGLQKPDGLYLRGATGVRGSSLVTFMSGGRKRVCFPKAFQVKVFCSPRNYLR